MREHAELLLGWRFMFEQPGKQWVWKFQLLSQSNTDATDAGTDTTNANVHTLLHQCKCQLLQWLQFRWLCNMSAGSSDRLL